MPAKDLGLKHTCWKCGAKFYDLKKAQPACPKCGADPRDAPVVKAPPAERRRPVREQPPSQEADLEESKMDDDGEEADEDLEEMDDDE
jgi:predicted  nucleic acid-binding Zn-ribbon protein